MVNNFTKIVKKALILTEVFPPAFNPRIGYLVKYLPSYDWQADIITQNTFKDNNFKYLIGNNKIIRVDVTNMDTPIGYIEKIWRLINRKRHFRNNKKPFIRAIESSLIKEDYSVIFISVSWNMFVLEAAYVVAKKWSLPLIVDLRDIHEQKPSMINHSRNLRSVLFQYLDQTFYKMVIRLRNNIVSKADAVISVSPWHVGYLSKLNKNVFLIYNGYDPKLFFPGIPVRTNKFLITYTGIVNSEDQRDPGLLFQAVKKLDEQDMITEDLFRIQFYTPKKFRKYIEENKLYPGVKKYIDFFDYVDYQDVPRILNDSAICLVLTNISDKDGPRGVLTTKFFEYLGVERPVLCVRSDEDILEDTIRKLNIGIAARTVNDAENFIKEKWYEWKDKGYTTANVIKNYKYQFSREYQANQFVEILNQVSNL